LKTVCFTGHRPNKIGGYDENNPVAQFVKKRLNEEINEAIRIGYRRFIFGGALGVDTWAGENVADLAEWYGIHCGIPIQLELYSPFEGQEGKWFDESKVRYYMLMSRCDKIVQVCDPGYAAWKMIVRDKAMVDQADLVIACWNGDLGKSGTGHTVSYAKEKGKPLIIIDPREAVA
jgi:uncharacterized phage-like protein YoqJ